MRKTILEPTKAEKGLQTSDFRLQTSDFRLQTSDFRLQPSDFRLSCSGFDWDVGFPASANLIEVILKIDEGVSCKLS